MPINEVIDEVIKDVQHRMHGALEALHAHFKTLRTGRANAAMLDGIIVDYYGTPTPLAQAAGIKVPEPALLIVEPWDKSMTAVIEKAIRTSDLGIQSRVRRQGRPRSDSRADRGAAEGARQEGAPHGRRVAHCDPPGSPGRQREAQENAEGARALRGR